MNIKFTTYLIIICSLFLSVQSFGHGRFILPSHTMLSADEFSNITVISSISNNVFHPDMPFGNNNKGIKVNPKLTKVFSLLHPFVIHPDSSKHAMSYQAFNRFSVSDLTLKQKGTYTMLIEQKPFIVTSFTQLNGEPGRAFGPGRNLPEGVTNIKRRQINMRSASYVSFNGLTDIQLQGKGLELTGHHFNDLFTEEPVEFQLLLDGNSVKKGTEISLIKEDTRHRNQRNTQTYATNQYGKIEVTFNEAGFYLLETQVTSQGNESGIDIMQSTLYLTLEVFPQ